VRVLLLTQLTELMEAIHTSTHDASNGTANETSDKINGKTRNEMRQARTHTWAPGTSPKLRFLQDLSIRVNPEVTKEVIHHAGLQVVGSLHLHLHVCKVIHLSLKSSDPFHRMLSLVNPITDVGSKERTSQDTW
jgi:predicted SprT family Zn-dependent metalloprotease